MAQPLTKNFAQDQAGAASRTLTVRDAALTDADRGIVRLDLQTLNDIGASIGDALSIEGTATAYARAMPIQADLKDLGVALLDSTLRHNAGVSIGEEITLQHVALPVATLVEFAEQGKSAGIKLNAKQLTEQFEHKPLTAGNVFPVKMTSGKVIVLKVVRTEPSSAVIVDTNTRFTVAVEAPSIDAQAPSYGELGGLSREVARVREMIELPIKRPDIFERLGIQPPRGVLLSGPPGTGKTLLARAVARECQASFFQINGPEIVGKHYGESEKHLRDIFKKAESEQPAVIFIDEIDAIAPKREALNGDRQVER
ncbi:MAG: AAA family ATPase, partial [Rhizobiaceae bacterium]